MEDAERISIIVPEEVSRSRADKVVAEHFKSYSRTVLQQAFDAGHVECNGKVIAKKMRVDAGDVITILLPEVEVSKELKPLDMSLEILYEDAYIVAINKAPGVVVHPGSGTGDDTLVHGVLHHTGGKLSPFSGEKRPGVVHRLDKETSGIIVFAKTDEAYLRMVEMFAERVIDKQYIALVNGFIECDSGSIKDPIDRHAVNRVKMAISEKGRPAHTDWMVEERYGKYATLVRCFLHTGRTHQIRLHMSHIGHPILGDGQYGYKYKLKDANPPKRVMLHAERMAFEHPVTKEPIVLVAPLPKDLEDQIANCRANI